MTREFLVNVLDACDGVEGSDGAYTPADNTVLAVLLASGQSGAAPINRVTSLKLNEAFVVLGLEEATYYFPYELVCGIKTTGRGKNAARTGFHA